MTSFGFPQKQTLIFKYSGESSFLIGKWETIEPSIDNQQCVMKPQLATGAQSHGGDWKTMSTNTPEISHLMVSGLGFLIYSSSSV